MLLIDYRNKHGEEGYKAVMAKTGDRFVKGPGGQDLV